MINYLVTGYFYYIPLQNNTSFLRVIVWPNALSVYTYLSVILVPNAAQESKKQDYAPRLTTYSTRAEKVEITAAGI